MAHHGRDEWENQRPSPDGPAPEEAAGPAPHEGVYLDVRRLAAFEHQLAWQAQELQRLSGTRGRFRRSDGVQAEQLREATDRVGGLEQEVRQLRAEVERGLGELRARVAEMERRMGGVLDARVRDAMSSGEFTSDLHRRHLRNAQAYRTLIAQNLRRFAVRLCPVGSVQGHDALHAARARAMAERLRMLLAPDAPGRPPVAEELLAGLAERGVVTSPSPVEAGPDLGTIVERATEIARELAGDTLPAVLVFGTDVHALPPGAYEPYNTGATGVPGFLVAPAYVIDGDQPQELVGPLVFVVPADAGNERPESAG